MSTETESNNILYLIVGGLIVAAGVFAYIYFDKGGEFWPKRANTSSVNLNITSDGVKGTVTTPDR